MKVPKLIVGGYQLEVASDFNLQIDYDIADIRDQSTRGSSSSLSVIIPGTSQANLLFNNIYDVNTQLTTFDPNKKTPATYYVDEVEVFRGNLQLIEIQKSYKGQLINVMYRCYLIGNSADLFLTLRNRMLSELDLVALNHNFDYTADKFNPVLGEGYAYPYIDYGLTEGADNTFIPVTDTWTFTNLKPAVFEKQYLDKIFEEAGFTYTSNFLNSDYYKRIIIPCNLGGPLRTPVFSPALNEFVARRINNLTQQPGRVGVIEDVNKWRFYNEYDWVWNPILINNVVSNAGNVYNTTTSIATIKTSGTYTFEATLNVDITVQAGNNVNQVDEVDFNTGFYVYIIKRSQISGDSEIAAEYFETTDNVVGNTNFTVARSVSLNALPLSYDEGDQVFLMIKAGLNNTIVTFRNGGIVTNHTPTLRLNLKTGTSFLNKVATYDIPYGGLVRMNELIPKGISQLDFLKGIILSENLYMEQDPNDAKNYFIEPRDEFLNTQPYINWTDKVDTSQPVIMYPSGELNIHKYTFRQQVDNDYANANALLVYKERYGVENKIFENDFSNGERVIETIFASTPNVGNQVNDVITPAFYTKSEDNTKVSSIDVVIRRLYWVGGINIGQSFTMRYGDPGGTTESRTGYYYAGATDNPLAPTLDLGFGIPKQLYYRFTGVYTTNNRYNLRYAKLIKEISSKNSKMVKMKMILTPNDMYQFTFRRLVYVIDSFYYVNKIVGFNPTTDQAVEVELLWLDGGEFIPMT